MHRLAATVAVALFLLGGAASATRKLTRPQRNKMEQSIKQKLQEDEIGADRVSIEKVRFLEEGRLLVHATVHEGERVQEGAILVNAQSFEASHHNFRIRARQYDEMRKKDPMHAHLYSVGSQLVDSILEQLKESGK